ncbi:hypothetical protein ACIQSO_12825 [Pseudomonas putida]|uniref:hypothetical protein n=1 Tax=Pseudomonas putida TaxID=303 RepID=UPI00383B0A28
MSLTSCLKGLATLALMLPWAGSANAQVPPAYAYTQALEESLGECSPHLRNLQYLLIERIHALEPLIAQRLAQVPETERRLKQLEKALDAQTLEYTKLRHDPERRQHIEQMEQEIWVVEKTVRDIFADERQLKVLKPALTRIREHMGMFVELQDELIESREECQRWARDHAQCHAEDLVPLEHQVKTLLAASHTLLTQLQSPLSCATPYPDYWARDCMPPDPQP